MAHTPGTWKVYDAYGEFIIVGAQTEIAKAMYGIRSVDETSAQANARLIASAPDLLAALTTLCDAILHGQGALPSTVPEWYRWEPITEARAAIEKAS